MVAAQILDPKCRASAEESADRILLVFVASVASMTHYFRMDVVDDYLWALYDSLPSKGLVIIMAV